ncbi:DUF7504 family protein [Halobaculum gomorrense]|uniref:Uncharacterized protein n=1 Tax=Halobaculum gomorrense TaxID=43928 RepID=A0A1M5R0R2_9EURY|nr:hypothetical protein [Halobaculum gomorrense]SHH19758.1 hypothetical protein SAMN05443636_2004 [Halobaculum gomorrense]
MTGRTDDSPSNSALVRGPESTLSAALADLDDGCCVLVTGDVSDDAYCVAASRYFGATQHLRRRVLALTTDGSASPSAWFPDGVDAGDADAAVVRLDDAVRDPAAATGESDAANAGGAGDAIHPSGTSTDDTSPAEPASLDLDGGGGEATDAAAEAVDHESTAGGMRAAILDAIEEVDGARPDDTDRSDRLGLRVGIFRVDMLCATLGGDATGTLLCEVAQTTRDRGGMAHFHLPRPTGESPRSDPVIDEFVDILGDSLDVIVELRSRETASAPEERWHILDWGTTEWNSLR